MNKKEIAEIKKLFTPSHCAITRICGCYVDAEKNIKTKLKEAFLSLEEEEMFKYFKIFKSTLSGTIGKNLLNMEFPLSQESEGGTQEFLLKLRNSELKDEALIDEFVSKLYMKKEGIKYVFYQDIFRKSDQKVVVKSTVETVCVVNGRLSSSELFDNVFAPYLK